MGNNYLKQLSFGARSGLACDTTLSTTFGSDLRSVDTLRSSHTSLKVVFPSCSGCFQSQTEWMKNTDSPHTQDLGQPHPGILLTADCAKARMAMKHFRYVHNNHACKLSCGTGIPILYLLHDFTKYQDREWTLADGSTTTKSHWFDIKRT